MGDQEHNVARDSTVSGPSPLSIRSGRIEA